MLRVVHLLRRRDVIVEELVQRNSRDPLANIAKFAICEAALLLLEVLPVERPHHIVERLLILCLLPDLQIQYRTERPALAVIRDRRIGGVLIPNAAAPPAGSPG